MFRIRYLIFLLGYLSVGHFGCTTATGEAATLPAPSPLAVQHFSAAEVIALQTIKQQFEHGLRRGYENRTLGHAYLQHATQLRRNFFAQQPLTLEYPFDGSFRLAQVAAAVDSLSFISNTCAVEVPGKEKTNFYCLAREGKYYDYLREIPDPSSLIRSFARDYPDTGGISPEMRRQMLLSARESLDLTNWDHQLFYALFQCWTNEELQAYQSQKNQDAAAPAQ